MYEVLFNITKIIQGHVACSILKLLQNVGIQVELQCKCDFSTSTSPIIGLLDSYTCTPI